MNFLIENINSWGENVFSFLLPLAWQSTLLILLLAALDRALHRKMRPSVRYALWLLVLLKLALPPSLALPTGVGWWLRPPALPVAQPKVGYTLTYGEAPTIDITGPTIMPLSSASSPIRLSLPGVALLLSFAGSFGLTLCILARLRQAARVLKYSSEASQRGRQLLKAAIRKTKLRQRVTLRITEQSMSPAVYGLRNPVILLPQALFDRLPDEKLEAVLLHECIHINRRDTWINCAQTLLQIFYWWHPLLWLANTRIRRLREEAVDAAVMLALQERREIYATTLLAVARISLARPPATLGLVGILESKSALKQRVERLIHLPCPRRAGLSLLSLVGVAGFAAVTLPMGQAPAPLEQQAQTTHTVENPWPDGQFSGNAEIELEAQSDKVPSTRLPGTAEGSSTLTQKAGRNDPEGDAVKILVDPNTGLPTSEYKLPEGHVDKTNQPLYVRNFKTDIATLSHLCGKSEPINPDEVFAAFRRHLHSLGMVFEPPRSIFYSIGKGNLTVRATLEELDLIEDSIQIANALPQSAVPFQTHVFKIDSKTVLHNLRQKDPRAKGVAGWNSSEALERCFAEFGVTREQPYRFAFSEAEGQLVVSATKEDLNKIAAAISSLNLRQVLIKAQVVDLKGIGPQNRGSDWLFPAEVDGHFRNESVGVIEGPQHKVLMRTLEQFKGIDLAQPQLITAGGRQAQIRLIHTQAVFKETMECGSVVEVTPIVISEGWILLHVHATVTEFLGYADPEEDLDGRSPLLPQARFRVRTLTAEKGLAPGQVLVLRNPTTVIKTFKNATSDKLQRVEDKKDLLLFVSAEIVDSTGNPLQPK